jgi:hypothetical protein
MVYCERKEMISKHIIQISAASFGDHQSLSRRTNPAEVLLFASHGQANRAVELLCCRANNAHWPDSTISCGD